jgi:hypothetical protein
LWRPPAALPGPLRGDVLACHDRLRLVHQALVVVEDDLARWDNDFLFALGEANPAAERAIEPRFFAWLASDRDVVEYRFRCRTWACRLVIKTTNRGRKWWREMGGAELRDRVSTFSNEWREFAEDLMEGEGAFLFASHMRLRQPSGAPLPGDELTPPPRPLEPPATVDGCEAASAALARELETRRAYWRRVEPPDHKFERSQEPPDPALARIVEARQPWFTNLLATTECRGRVCRQSNRYHLLSRTFWSKPMGREGRRAVFDEGTESVVYEEVER